MSTQQILSTFAYIKTIPALRREMIHAGSAQWLLVDDKDHQQEVHFNFWLTKNIVSRKYNTAFGWLKSSSTGSLNLQFRSLQQILKWWNRSDSKYHQYHASRGGKRTSRLQGGKRKDVCRFYKVNFKCVLILGFIFKVTLIVCF